MNGEQISLEPDWSVFSGMPPAWVNAIATQLGSGPGSGSPDGILLLLGTADIPIMTGPIDAAFMDSKLPMTAIAKVILTRSRCVELMEILRQAMVQYDKFSQEMGADDARS